MVDVSSKLQLVDIDQICLHEAHEPSRLVDTCEAIEEEGVLRHPPLAVLMRDGRYLILDGAHRTCALQNLGCRRIPVQVVEQDEFLLEAWVHLVPIGPWLGQLRDDSSLNWVTHISNGWPIAQLVEQDGQTYFLHPKGSEDDAFVRLDAWHRVVEAYSKEYPVQRMPESSNPPPEAGKVILRYPACSLSELEELVMAGRVLPAGVTRFVVSGRLLNLRIPLHLLTDPLSPGEWERLCARWSESLRLYSEAVYYCEV
ncbi:ParB N-terminal domain-containing protein [Effusibacillus consociatus]|uniref:ParB N-terminal domain-containing protein n=1 Tax=Effusibacillus consociatus TaxID=1117041 RepID=A0ABV9Q053_9BACL